MHAPTINPNAGRTWFAGDIAACRFYRCEMPALYLKDTVRDIINVRQHTPTEAIVNIDDVAERNVFQRPVKKMITQVIQELRSQGYPVTIEIDDNIWGLSYNNPVYVGWPKEKSANMAASIKRANGVIVTSEALAQVVKRFNQNIAIIPNSIGAYAPPSSARTYELDTLKLGWAGSWSHKEDVKLILPALMWAGQQPNVELHIFGYDCIGQQATPGVYTKDGIKYTFYGWEKDMRQHYGNISMLDIAFAPVVDNAFNRARSNIKWVEHSWYGTPVIASKVECYSDILHGQTGLLAKHSGDFLTFTKTLVKNAGLREYIGQAAQAEAHANYTIEKVGPLWQQALEAFEND